MKTKKRLLSILLSLAMVVGLMPGMSITAYAAPEGTAWTSNNSLPTSSGTYYLTADITISGSWKIPDGTTTLDLNGYGIMQSGNGTVIETYGSKNGSVIIKDSNPSAEHYVTLANWRGISVSNSGTETAVDSSGNGTVRINGGYITGGASSAISLQDDGVSATMDGGNIIGNTRATGGGVWINNGTFTMNGGSIMYNRGTANGEDCGGGVYLNSNHTFTMKGGTISHNSAVGDGGGVNVWGVFNMEGGSITENYSARNGGGVAFEGTSSKTRGFNMTGGFITDNVAVSNGGGVYNKANQPFKISGTVNITGNKKGEANNNVTGNAITVNGALSTNSRIGVTYNANTTFTSGLGTTGGVDEAGAKTIFSSDNDSLMVKFENNEAKLVENPSYIALNNTAPTITVTKATGNDGEGPQIGDTLSAVTTPGNATPVTYQWYIVDDSTDPATETLIEGKTEATLVLTKDEVGKKIGVKVSQEAGADGGSSPAVNPPMSGATVAVEKKTASALDGNTAKTNAGISYSDEKATPTTGYEISTDGQKPATLTDGSLSLTDIIDSDTKKIYVRSAATDDTAAGAWVEVTLTSRPDAPTGLTTENSSSTTAQDGKIKGTSAAMEYKLKDSSDAWTTATATETKVKSGTYLVRTKATADAPVGKTTEVKVITAAQNVENLIDALPVAENVGTTDKTSVEAARAAYNALTSTQQGEVSDAAKAKLEAAEVALVKKLIDELPAASGVTANDETAITAARTAYNNLTDEQKTQIGDTLKAKLEADEVALAIVKLPAANAVTTDNKAAIEAARKDYDELSDEQKAQVGDTLKKKLEAAEVALTKKLIEAIPDPSEVTTSDADKVAAAKTAYDNLNENQKNEITEEEKDKLDAAVQALSDAEVSDVEALIKALPSAKNVTADNDAAIKKVRAAYDKLTEAQQAFVKATLKDKLAADEVALAIAKLPAAESVTADDADAIEAARTAYDALTSTQKGSVGNTAKKKLEDAEAVIQGIVDTEAANAVKAKIEALPAEVTPTDKADIEEARKAYDGLTDAQKAKIDENTLKKLTDAEDALAVAEVNQKINELPATADVTTANKDAIEAARAAYDALTDAQKEKIDANTLKKLTDAEEALAAAEAADKAAKELEAAKKVAQAAMNEQVTVTQKGNKFTVKWKKASSADGYYVYAQYCGKKITKPVKTIKKNTTTKTTITKINGKKINQKKNFRVYVVPYKIIDGKKVTLGKSTVAHLVGAKNAKYSNVKKLTLKKKKYTFKVGKTVKIKGKVTLVNKNKKHIPKGHGAKLRYKSSDISIATVSKNGKIKGIKKGTCTIYVYAINGLTKKVKVTVK